MASEEQHTSGRLKYESHSLRHGDSRVIGQLSDLGHVHRDVPLDLEMV